MSTFISVVIPQADQLAAAREILGNLIAQSADEAPESGFRSRDLHVINETLSTGFGNTSRQLTDIKSGIDEIGDRLSRRNCRGKRRGKYDDETVSFCLGCLSAAEGNATIRNGLNTRLTHQAVFEYNRRELEARGISDAAAFTRIIRAQQAREQRQRMKALDAARTCASEDLPNSQVQNGSGNGILQTMKNGATTLALMAAMLCGLGLFWGSESRCDQPPPTAQKCCSERIVPTGSQEPTMPMPEAGLGRSQPDQEVSLRGGDEGEKLGITCA